jgi:hypothetical protein
MKLKRIALRVLVLLILCSGLCSCQSAPEEVDPFNLFVMQEFGLTAPKDALEQKVETLEKELAALKGAQP